MFSNILREYSESKVYKTYSQEQDLLKKSDMLDFLKITENFQDIDSYKINRKNKRFLLLSVENGIIDTSDSGLEFEQRFFKQVDKPIIEEEDILLLRSPVVGKEIYTLKSNMERILSLFHNYNFEEKTVSENNHILVRKINSYVIKNFNWSSERILNFWEKHC